VHPLSLTYGVARWTKKEKKEKEREREKDGEKRNGGAGEKGETRVNDKSR